MSDEPIKKKRGRPPKKTVAENTKDSSPISELSLILFIPHLVHCFLAHYLIVAFMISLGKTKLNAYFEILSFITMWQSDYPILSIPKMVLYPIQLIT